MLVGWKRRNILSSSCFGDVNTNKADGDEPANAMDPLPTDMDVEHLGGGHDYVSKHERPLVLDDCLDVNLLMDQSSPPASHSGSELEDEAGEASFGEGTSTWTGQKKPKIRSPPTSGALDKIAQDDDEHSDKIVHFMEHKQEQGAGQIQALLDVDDDTIAKETYCYFEQLKYGPHDDFVSEYDEPQQLAEVYERLALYRIRAHELSKGRHLAELNDEKLKEQYPPAILQEEGYFKHYEKSLDWYFHPEHCKIAGLDDYQRLVLCDNGEYDDWDEYRLNYSTHESDREFIQYCEEISAETKWIEHYLELSKTLSEWRRVENRALHQAVKIATGFHNIYAHLVLSGYKEHMWSVKFDYSCYKELDCVYFEIWKRVAKQKMDFTDALWEVKDMFPLRSFEIKKELENTPLRFRRMKDNYDTYVAYIDEKVSEDIAYLLIVEAVKKMIPKRKIYLDYAKKKLAIAEDIGLVPKRSGQEVTRSTQGCGGDIARRLEVFLIKHDYMSRRGH